MATWEDAVSTPECPRCGYDLRGPVAAWTESCPLDGTCSECGLAFRWGDLFRPERLAPRWSFEHGTGRRVRRLLATLWRAPRGRALWGAMPLAAPIHTGRLLRLVALVVLGAYLWTLGCAVVMALAWAGWPGASPVNALFPSVPGTAGGVASVCLWPYASADAIPVIPSPLVRVVLLWGVLAPLPFLLLGQSMAKAKVRKAHLWRAWALFLPVVAIVYALAQGVMAGVFWFVQTRGLGMWGYTVLRWSPVALLLVVPWNWRWWSAFVRGYLRLDHAAGVTAAMLVISLLAAFLTILLAGQDLANQLAQIYVWSIGWP